MCDQTNSKMHDSKDVTEDPSNSETTNVEKSSYSYLVDKILKNDLLKQKIEMWSKDGIINLIQPEWKSVLHNNPIYQKHKNNLVKYSTKQQRKVEKHYVTHNIIDWDNHFNILVAGYFSVKPGNDTSNTSINVYNCAPISEIGKVMDEKTIDNAKFFLDSCGGICPKCRLNDSVDTMWCVQNVQVFLPEGFNPTNRDYAEKIFASPTIGIAIITITMKYDFGTMSKVGGKIKSICFVQERLLQDKDECNDKILTLDETGFTLPQKRKAETEEVYFALPKEVTTNEKYEVKMSKIQ